MRRALAAWAIFAAVAANAGEVERLQTLARVWATVKYLHPQVNVDWDAALVHAVPAVRTAQTDEAFATAVNAMLHELGDPATRVAKPAPKSNADVPLFRTEGDVLVVNLGPFAETHTAEAVYANPGPLLQELGKAKSAVIDVRYAGDDQETFRWYVEELFPLSATPLVTPARQYVFHSGYRAQGGITVGYYTGLLTIPGAPLRTARAAPERIAFVTNATSTLPRTALALRDAGKAILVSATPLNAGAAADVKPVEIGGGQTAYVRTSIVQTDVRADVVAADPMKAAIEAVAQPFPARPPAPAADATIPPWKPDEPYRDMSFPDEGYRFLAAARLWAVIDFFYPYKSLIGDWDASFARAIPQFLGAKNADEYVSAVLEFSAEIEDGHVSVFGHPALIRFYGEWRLPVDVRVIEGKYVATESAGELKAGDVIESVDGEPLADRVARLRKYLTASTETARTNRVLATALRGPKESTAVLKLAGGRTVSVARVMRIPEKTGEPYRLLDGNIGYVDLTLLEPQQVDAMFDALMKTKAIIFDMRGYPKGTAWPIAPRINVKKAKVGAQFRRVQLSGANTEEESASGFFFEQQLPKGEGKPLYSGKTVMLIDDRAISQSEHSGLFFEAASDITFVGSPTAGANGDVTALVLPGNVRVGFTGHDVRHADGRQLQRVGLQPHVRVEPTIAGIRAGRDEVLERAIAHVNQTRR